MTIHGKHLGSGKLAMSVLLLACFYIAPAFTYSLTNCSVTGYSNTTDSLKVLCYKMHFQRVPPQIPLNTGILDISFNFIFQIKASDFDGHQTLLDLNISNNRISWIQEKSFTELVNLQSLNLARNRLRNISGDMLHGLRNLSVLRIDGNFIESFEESSFEELVKLNIVNLTKNKLLHIENIRPVLKSPYLNELYIGSNNFSAFHSSNFSTSPSTITRLDLNTNPFTIFNMTENIFPNLDYFDLSKFGSKGRVEWNIQNWTYLSSVRTLNLSGVTFTKVGLSAVLQTFRGFVNKVRLNYVNWERIDLKIACSPSLHALRLKHCEISKLYDETFRPCANLTELDMGENRISYLTPSIFKDLKQLMKLQLQINSITLVNNSFHALSALEFLDLSRNAIAKLTCQDFANLSQLRTLYLYSNRISEISACVFQNLRSLDLLKLGSNKILSIKNAFMFGPLSLRQLQLPFNKLNAIKEGTFQKLTSLRDLELSDNQIYELEDHAFIGLENLTSLKLSSNKISARTISGLKVFSGMPNLRVLELYNNVISYEFQDRLTNPPFTELKSLTSLAIHSQRRGFGKHPSNLLEGLTSLRMYYAGNMNLMSLPLGTFNSTPNLFFLDLTKNVFSGPSALSPELFLPLQNLTKLLMSRDQLQSLDFLFKANLSKLSVLRAAGNLLDVINQTLIQSLPQLKYLDLQNNTFSCDCNNAWFLDWAKTNNQTQVLYLNRYTCSYPTALRGMSLAEISTESCNVNFDFILFTSTSSLVLLTIIVSFFYSFVRWQIVYAYYLFLALLYDGKKKKMHEQNGFQYDAFVSYNTQDEAWVLEQLIPKLEGEQGWRLCFHHRDFEPGRPIIDNIVDGIYSSRKTICLITCSYLASEWCSREIQVASFRLFDEQKDVLILVFLDDIPTHQLSPYHRMRKLVKKRTYISWPKPGVDTRVFWEKLRRALETKEGPEEESCILSGQENEVLLNSRQ